VLAVVAAGVAPALSSAADSSCPYFVNGQLPLPVPVPGDLNLCAAWQAESRLPDYPVHEVAIPYDSCEQFNEQQQTTYGKTFPDPAQLSFALRPSVLVRNTGGDLYRIRITFGVPDNARIEIYRPTWPDMTDTQRAALDAFFDLVLVHERGHENILGRLSAKFGSNGLYEVPGGLKRAQRRANRLAQDALSGIVQDDPWIDAAAYDGLTEHGARQSALGGTDYPSLEHLCEVELPITSTFDTSDEGWTAVGDAASTVPDHHLLGGNPGGFVEIEDLALNGVWYWAAPGKYLGDRSHAYGTLLTFDLKQSALDRPFDDVDVRMEGGGQVLTMRFGSPPGLDWTSYVVPLDITGGWTDGATETPATEQQIQTVLDSLDVLRIRGEYRTGADIGGLDNVAFGAPRSDP
jgi:hypothetical protein